MAAVHGYHDQGPGIVLFDGCARCNVQAHELWELDDENLRKLASMAEAVKARPRVDEMVMSVNDLKAIDNLRLWGRIVYRSGISEEVAR